MSGQTSGPGSGSITGVGHTSTSNGITYYNQVLATYDSDDGDSGAPIYCFINSELRAIGIHKGRATTQPGSPAMFSTVSYINQDIGVLPLKLQDYAKGDFDDDDDCDFDDFVEFAATYNSIAFDVNFISTGDFDEDGDVDFDDHVEFAGIYNTS